MRKYEIKSYINNHHTPTQCVERMQRVCIQFAKLGRDYSLIETHYELGFHWKDTCTKNRYPIDDQAYAYW